MRPRGLRWPRRMRRLCGIRRSRYMLWPRGIGWGRALALWRRALLRQGLRRDGDVHALAASGRGCLDPLLADVVGDGRSAHLVAAVRQPGVVGQKDRASVHVIHDLIRMAFGQAEVVRALLLEFRRIAD